MATGMFKELMKDELIKELKRSRRRTGESLEKRGVGKSGATSVSMQWSGHIQMP